MGHLTDFFIFLQTDRQTDLGIKAPSRSLKNAAKRDNAGAVCKLPKISPECAQDLPEICIFLMFVRCA